ncbi:MAG: hypothetical protein JSR41_12925 [Proteobacteria bacterium]|nr:hypothetical protein [Pseudomonadota bacterium]
MKDLMNNVRVALLNKVARRELAVALAGAGAMIAPHAHAAGEFTVDTTTIVATIVAGVTAVSAIGLATLSLVVVIKLFKWMQRTL